MISEEQTTQLMHENQALKAELALFQKRSERYIDPQQPQLDIFQDNTALFSNAEAAGEQLPEATFQVAAHTRKKKKTNSKDLPRRIEIIPLSEEDKQCSCGACKTVIRYETKELLHYQPCVIEIVEQRREVAACPKGCDGSIMTAPAPLHILPKIKATAEFLAFLIVSKLETATLPS